MKEEWADIKGFEGIYLISSEGRVKSPAGKVTFSERHGMRVWKERLLKNKTDKSGYKRVCLYKDKKQYTFLVHRLVAEAFIPNVKGCTIVNHLNGNPSDNNVENLEWTDHYGNLMHAFKNDLNKNNCPIVLHNVKTGEIHRFLSLSEAGHYIGYNHGYLSAVLKSGQDKVDDYEIFIKPFRLKNF